MQPLINCVQKNLVCYSSSWIPGFLVRNLEPWIERQKSGLSGKYDCGSPGGGLCHGDSGTRGIQML